MEESNVAHSIGMISKELSNGLGKWIIGIGCIVNLNMKDLKGEEITTWLMTTTQVITKNDLLSPEYSIVFEFLHPKKPKLLSVNLDNMADVALVLPGRVLETTGQSSKEISFLVIPLEKLVSGNVITKFVRELFNPLSRDSLKRRSLNCGGENDETLQQAISAKQILCHVMSDKKNNLLTTEPHYLEFDGDEGSKFALTLPVGDSRRDIACYKVGDFSSEQRLKGAPLFCEKGEFLGMLAFEESEQKRFFPLFLPSGKKLSNAAMPQTFMSGSDDTEGNDIEESKENENGASSNNKPSQRHGVESQGNCQTNSVVQLEPQPVSEQIPAEENRSSVSDESAQGDDPSSRKSAPDADASLDSLASHGDRISDESSKDCEEELPCHLQQQPTFNLDGTLTGEFQGDDQPYQQSDSAHKNIATGQQIRPALLTHNSCHDDDEGVSNAGHQETVSPSSFQLPTRTRCQEDQGTQQARVHCLQPVGDNLVSEAVTENVLLLEKLSKSLDKESKVANYWEHLAYALEIPPTEIKKIGFYSKHSPTEDLFDVLSDAHDVKVGDLKETLKEMHRNDVIKDLREAGFTDDDCLLSDLMSTDPKFIALLSSKLDVESIANWKPLATKFGIEKQTSNQFGLHGAGPTEALFLYIQTDEKLRCLTMGKLHEHIGNMGRNKLVSHLEKSGFKGDDTRLVRNEVVDGSDLLAEIGKHLNIESRNVKNWRNLANKLEIPPEVYGAFDTSEAEVKSSTKEMFKWLAQENLNLNVDDLLAALKKIGRFDLVDLVREETNNYFAKKTFLKLQEMHRDADKHQKKGGLSNDLKKNASNKGFEIVDNDGKGNCMFHALCDQLKYKKHLEISHQDLRKDLVKYLHGHPKLSDGTELAGFIVTDRFPSWTEYLGKMAQDGTCGENLILFAAANCYKCDIQVISSVPNHDCTIRPVPPISDAVKLVLGHIVEEHYVSLRPSMSAEDREVQL